RVRSKHPLQMSLASGAAGVHLGPRALALAADLNKAKGLSMRKTCAVLRDCFGLQLSSGGLSQALDRLAAKVKPQYDTIATELRQAPVVHSDETSWWVAGPDDVGGIPEKGQASGGQEEEGAEELWR